MINNHNDDNNAGAAANVYETLEYNQNNNTNQTGIQYNNNEK